MSCQTTKKVLPQKCLGNYVLENSNTVPLTKKQHISLISSSTTSRRSSTTKIIANEKVKRDNYRASMKPVNSF